jgi:C-terminal processing protease CtpA/Prc
MQRFAFGLLIIAAPLWMFGQANNMTTGKYREDFNYFWQSINDEYSYLDKKQTDWQKVKELYNSKIDSVTTRDQFVGLLEKALYEIYDHHAILNTNTSASFRLVPSGTDIWAEYVNGKPVITELRKGFGSEACCVKAGMEVLEVNDIPINTAVSSLLPRTLRQPDTEARNFVLRQLLAGDHVRARKFTLQYKGVTADYYPDNDGMKLENIRHDRNIESRMIGKAGYILINDCLYNTDIVAEFDSVMQTMKNTSSLIIDLRNTPSGGNTIVARAIMSWFIEKDHFYQRHEYPADERMTGIKRSWLEIISPRPNKYYNKPLVILCDHWTASLGEAIVIGFEALKRPFTKVIGTPMARLCGAVYSYEMPNSKIHFSFPAEKLYTVDGLPREKYVPGILVDPVTNTSSLEKDIFLERALSYLRNIK